VGIIYGPVASWRLGRSLGIDLLNVRRKVCDFDCVYCQLGKTRRFIVEPEEFISLEELNREIESLRPIDADYATFSGMGEPTLARNLGEAIEMARSILDLPIAVLTNSSLMFQVMFVQANEGSAQGIAELARSISPDEVQINTPLRPSRVKSLPPENIANIKTEFGKLRNVITVYEAPSHEVRPLDITETLRRRPGIE